MKNFGSFFKLKVFKNAIFSEFRNVVVDSIFTQLVDLDRDIQVPFVKFICMYLFFLSLVLTLSVENIRN